MTTEGIDQSKLQEDKSSNRIPKFKFHFGNVSNRPKLDASLISLEDAIQILGVRRFPEKWGSSPAWTIMPARHISGKMYRYVMKKKDNVWKRIKYEESIVFDVDEYRNAHKVYNLVRKKIREALVLERIKAYGVSDEGALTKIESGRRFIWKIQTKSIFYTGYYRLNKDADRFILYLDRDDFDKWINNKQSRPISRNLLGIIGKTIREFTDERKLRISKGYLLANLRYLLKENGVAFSDRQYDREIWSLLYDERLKGGRPSHAEESALNDAWPDLRERITQAIAEGR